MHEPWTPTRREIEVPLDAVLIARLDAEGRLSGISGDLQRLSGYDAQELIGEYHETLLHSDVPREVVEDLRRDLDAGRPWSGVLKLCCRTGEFCWVQADMVPVSNGVRRERVVSVFRRAMRHQVDRADEAYRRFRERRADDVAIEHGAVVSANPVARLLRRLADIPARRKLLFGVGVTALSGFVLGLAAAGGLRGWPEGVGTWGLVPGLVGVGIGVALVVLVGTSQVRRIHDARRVVEVLATGEFGSPVDCSRDDESGRLLQAIKVLQTRLDADLVSAGSVAGSGEALGHLDGRILHAAVERVCAEAAAFRARSDEQERALDGLLEIARTLRTEIALGDPVAGSGRGLRSGNGLARAIDQLSSPLDGIRESLRSGDDLVARLDGVTFRNRLLVLNAALDLLQTSERMPTSVLEEGRELVRDMSECAVGLHEVMKDSVGHVDAGMAIVSEVRAQLQALSDPQDDAPSCEDDDRSDGSRVHGLLARLGSDLLHFETLLREGTEVSERLTAGMRHLEQVTGGDRSAARPSAPVQSDRETDPPLRSAKRTATISPLRPVRHELGAPLPKIGRGAASSGAAGDGWEVFRE